LSLEIPVVFAAASGAGNSLRPAQGSYGINAGLYIAVEKDCLLKGLNG
jgi:hypothetical protein